MRPREVTPPVPTRSGGSTLSGLFGVTVVVGAVVLARRPALGWTVFGGLATGGVLVLVGRRSRRRTEPGGAWSVRRRVPWWVPTGTAALAGVGVGWLALGTVGRILLASSVGLLLILSGWFALRLAQPNSRVKRETDTAWRARVEWEWPATARAAGLEHPDSPGRTAPLVGPAVAHGPAALAVTVDLDAVLAAPDDVQTAVPTLRRRLRADHVRVEPAGIDRAVVRAYRRHPLDVRVTWSDLQRVDGAGEWVPFGLTETGRMACLRWRLSTVLFGLPDAGKTMTVRAYLAGLSRQGVPHRLWLWDNRADFRPLSRIAYRYALDADEGLDLLRELAGHMDARVRDCPDLDTGHLHHPTVADPADVLVVGELLSAQRGLRSDAAELLRRFPAEGRPVSISLVTTVQTSLKEVIGPIRDLFRQRVAAKLWDASLVDPALGDGALERGGEAHLIPGALPGVLYVVDPHTGWPVMARGADVPPEDTAAALVDPYRALMGPGLRVIDGELA